MKKNKKLKTFFINGGLITLCSIILRSIAVSFNVYVANTAGAEAVGLYSLLGGVFGFSVTLALSGLNLALTRLFSEALALKDKKGAIRTLNCCFSLAILFGSISFIMLFSFAKPLAVKYLLEPRAELPLKILSFCLPAIALSSVFNGYFTAVRRAYKNALAQLTEMLAKILFTFLFFSKIPRDTAELACVALVLGSVLSEFCSFGINLTLYIFERFKYFKKTPNADKGSRPYKKILSISMPVALTSYVRSALLSVEHSLIPKGLDKYGASKTNALSLYGTLTGMALPVINFPYALIGSFTSLLIPEVAESHAKGEKRHVKYITFRTYQSCLTFAFCVCGIFFVFSDALGSILYSSSEAAKYIRLLSFLVPIMYADTSTDAILKGLGEQLHCMKVNIADAFLSVTLVAFLVPRYGIVGYIATIYIAEIVNAFFSISRLIKVTKLRFPIVKTVISPIFCVIGAGAIYNVVLHLFPLGLTIPSVVIGILIFILIYFILINLTCTFSLDDIKWFFSIFKQ